MGNLPDLTDPELSDQPVVTWNRYIRIGLGAVLASAIVGFAWLLWYISESWRIRREQPGRLIVLLFRRIYRSGRRLGAQTRCDDTPLEYGERLGSRLDQVAAKSWLNKYFTLARQEIDLVVKLYNSVVYSPHPVKREDGQSALDAWQRLRWRLWLSRFKSR
jgi:hypothetical protein